MAYTDVLLSLLLTIITLQTVNGMNCFTCNSTLDHNCQEKFNHNFTINPLRSEPCTVWDTRYCIKITGIWGGVVGTHRFCSSRDLGDQCQDVQYPDHDRRYRACVYTCSSDNCNAAGSLWSRWTWSISILLTFISFTFYTL